jgi:peptidoglycan/xylan/chitin deacetylase (PgdA/CDA1 family)
MNMMRQVVQVLRRTFWLVVCAPLSLGGLVAQVSAAQPSDEAIVWDGTLRRIRVPILMYHYVGEIPFDADAVRRELSVTPAQFREHLSMMFYEGYTPISLYALHNALMRGDPLPAKPVVLTFDDGYIDHYATAFPALRELGFTATFFVPTAFMDEQRPGHLTWEQVREMSAAGMSMEPHTKTHRELDGVTYEVLVYEVLGSIESLGYYTGMTPHMFSYPVGRYDDFTLRVFSEIAIWRAVTTDRGMLHTTDNRLEVSRMRVPGGASAATLRAILAGS